MNLVMDCYLLILVCNGLKLKIRYKRIAVSACIGSAGYGMILVLQIILEELGFHDIWIHRLLLAAGMIVFGGIMVKITCQTKGIRELLRGMGYLFTVSFLLGGILIFARNNLPEFEKKSGSLFLLMGVGFWGFVLCKRIVRYCSQKQKSRLCYVELPGDEGAIQIMALIDTGNGLQEPISHKPVAILSGTVWQRMQSQIKTDKFKIIPYHSIGRKNGLLEGYEIESLAVKGEIGWIRYENVIIAVSADRLSDTDSYQMILPPELA